MFASFLMFLSLTIATPPEKSDAGGSTVAHTLFLTDDAPITKADLRQAFVETYVYGVICRRRDPIECREARAEDVTRNTSLLLDYCDREKKTDEECMALLVTSTIESGFRAHPTCSGISPTCASDCDYSSTNPNDRSTCLIACAESEGRSASSARKCNDHGTSRGFFQLKRGTQDTCESLVGHPIDPHRIEEAAECYLALVNSNMSKIPGGCKPNNSNRFLIGWKRTGKGLVDRDTGEPVCDASLYALRGRELAQQLNRLK